MYNESFEKNIFSVDSVDKFFAVGRKNVSIFNNASARFSQQESYALTGVSGSGKSTLIHLLAGLDFPTSGAILFNEKSIARFTQAEKQFFLHKYIGLIFQLPYLILELSVLENIMLKELIESHDKKKLDEYAQELIAFCGLSEKINTPVALLSGGEQQRVAIARALCNKPKFLLADEPTAHLDTETRDDIIELLLSLRKKQVMGLIIATHDPEVIKRMNYVYEIREQQLHAR